MTNEWRNLPSVIAVAQPFTVQTYARQKAKEGLRSPCANPFGLFGLDYRGNAASPNEQKGEAVGNLKGTYLGML